jgi:integrase
MRGDGRVFQRGGSWWLAYYAPKDGRSVERREPAMVTEREGAPPRSARTAVEARRHLKRRLREIAVHKAGVRPFQGPTQERVRFEELVEGLERDYEVRGLHSIRSLKAHLVHVRRYFGEDRALAVTTARLRDFATHQQVAGLSPQSIHHQLKAIRRAFRLAVESGLVSFVPTIPTVTVRNARQGFLSRADFEAVLAGLGDYQGCGEDKRFVPDTDLQDFTAFAWWTGMRRGEIASLTWEAFDRETWTLRLHARDAKTGHGRVLTVGKPPLREIIERRIRARRLDCPLIFHRPSRAKVDGQWRELPGQAVVESGRRGCRPSSALACEECSSTTCAGAPCATWSRAASIQRWR